MFNFKTAANPILQDFIIMSGSSTHGSAGTAIRRFATVAERGSISAFGISYSPSSTNGDAFIIGATGTYAMGWFDRKSVTGQIIGFTKNQSDLTQDTNTINSTMLIATNWTPIEAGSVNATVFLNSGIIIRCNDGGGSNDTVTPRFFLTRVS